MFRSSLSGLDPASQRRAIRSMDAMTRAGLYARHPAIQQDAVLHSELQRRNLLPVGSYHPGVVQGLTPRGYLSPEEARANLRESKGEPRYPDLVVQEVVSAPVSANLSTLAGSSPLANLSLDPFAFTPDTGVEVPTVFANEGGAVMPGLGFRPLGYSTGGTADKIWSEFDAVTKSDLTKAEMAGYIYQNLGDLEMIAAENPSRAQMLESVKQWSDFDAFMESIMSPESPPAFDESLIEEGASIPFEDWQQAVRDVAGSVGDPGYSNLDLQSMRDHVGNLREVIPPEEQDLPAYLNPSNEDLRSPTGGMGVFPRGPVARITESLFPEAMADRPQGMPHAYWGALKASEALSDSMVPTDKTEPTAGYPGMQAGGHVGRGTMAGELGRRGDLSVRQAGETMFERMKRLRGYAGGGYASRGTVAGELPRYGHMNVREEGESLGELHKRHRDQDWYNRMGGGLGSFRRRMA